MTFHFLILANTFLFRVTWSWLSRSNSDYCCCCWLLICCRKLLLLPAAFPSHNSHTPLTLIHTNTHTNYTKLKYNVESQERWDKNVRTLCIVNVMNVIYSQWNYFIALTSRLLNSKALLVLERRKFIFLFINPFVPNAPFLYPRKTSENLKVFQRVEKGCIGNEWVNFNSKWSILYEVIIR